MRFRHKPPTPVSLDITPLVDVVFTLVIFFMITTTFSSVSGIKMDLPEASTTEAAKTDKQVTVTVSRAGQFFIQGESVAEDQLEPRLLNAVKGEPNQLIVVQVDKESHFDPVVKVLDTARKLGLTRLAIAAKPTTDKEAKQ
ncbi:MAG: biopolymer transporter ExbD [Magnetococcales bacterium]|nr:biopolymer transporter ExbD [Magnetococcales bacterium]NGZ27116.1 biopolymer transporter ExbD [Magnetococcales bacterium]